MRFVKAVLGQARQASTPALTCALEELSGCRIALVATGADRDDTIILDDPFA